jgi:hypothetical protein
LGSPDEAATYAGLSVQLLGKSEVPIRWQVGPVEQSTSPRLVLLAERGKLTIEFEEVAAASQAVTCFVDAVTTGNAVTAGNESASTWSQALAAMELTDTIEISLRRGRMIEVHQQQLTEQMAFKGTMSAIGCGVLLVLPPLLLFCGWLAELVGLPVSLARSWQYILLGLLLLFLSLQLMPKLLFKQE